MLSVVILAAFLLLDLALLTALFLSFTSPSPVFLLIDVTLMTTLVLSFMSPGVRPYRPQVVRMLCGANAGFILANGTLWLVMWGILRGARPGGPWPSTALHVAIIVLMFAGPVVASVLGVGVGIIVGLRPALGSYLRGGRTRG